MCNISAFKESKDLMLKEDIPQTILMIALVRSVSALTKQLCLRVLLNMLDGGSIVYFVKANIIRAFSTLAAVPDAIVQAQCAKGFLVLTGMREGRMEIAVRKSLLMSLFRLIQSPDTATRNMAGIAVYNLLCCDDSWESVALAGAIALIKVLVTVDSSILREASAQILLRLTQRPTLHVFLADEPLVHILVAVLHHSSAFAFEAAICALASLSHYEIFREKLVENNCATVLFTALTSGKIQSPHMAEEVVRCLYLLSFEMKHALQILLNGQIMLSMHIINKRKLCTPSIACMMTFILRNLSQSPEARESLVQENALSLLLSLLEMYPSSKSEIFSALSNLLYNLSKEEHLHEDLMSSNVMEVVSMMVPSSTELVKGKDKPLHFGSEDILRICATVNLLSFTTSCHTRILNGKCVDTFSHLLRQLPESDASAAIENEIANCICNITTTANCREQLNADGATELLLQLTSRSTAPETQKYCSVALSRLSESSQLGEGVVSSLLVLSLKMDEREQADWSRKTHRRSSTKGDASTKDTFQDALRDGLLSSPKHKTGAASSFKDIRPSAPMASLASVLSADGHASEMVEKEHYVGRHYEQFAYTIVQNGSWTEKGGMSQLRKLEMRGPAMVEQAFEFEDRRKELIEIPLDLKPLPKEDRNAEIGSFARRTSSPFMETFAESDGVWD